MKKLFSILSVVALMATTFTSCNKGDDFDYDGYNEQLRKNQERIDSTLRVQKPILEAYAMEHFENPVYNDSTGIWFEILQPATPTENPYEYPLTSNGQWITPTATVKYKGELLNGTVFDESSQAISMNIVEQSQYGPGLIPAWPIAFRPKTIVFGGETFHTGLVEDGLQKGHKIRFVAPSPYCYDNRKSDKIPADSPLVFTIEVIDIK